MRVKTVIPAHVIAPVLVMILVNIFTYNITPIWTNQMKQYCMEMTFDKNIPFVSVFVVIYILAYLKKCNSCLQICY